MSKPISKLELFTIGVSAGTIAAVFPRLLPLLSPSPEGVTLDLFTEKYLIAVAIFAIIIGVSMVWMYMNTQEHSKHLFLTALALPSVLSGGINVDSVSSAAEQKLSNLEQQTQVLQKKLKDQNQIPFIEIDGLSIQPITIDGMSFLDVLGISTAYAQDVLPPTKREESSSSVNFNTESLNSNYTVVLKQSSNKQDIVDAINELKSNQITNVVPYKINNQFYLLNNERTTKTQAILDAVEFKNKANVSPSIVQFK